ncbi:unnamed protein product [Musa acuminata subsp. malaccensis]|uniref:(wild Malaysian banana) hypothetical protein n=1 Tax=Musa acuminata subsp. malaccensis TaxID=214687 RepID=A0A804KS35_MUSAM|nr:PREDICTED: uncharacterized protein LOC103999818 isoform X1 [Musa acuminata subsp. malaccensis]CAG1852446.1 unnamed protein product [Musa acuminata subsp. malaccensis]
MTCYREQGKVLCFCVALREEGRVRWEEEVEEEATAGGMRITDYLQESNEDEVEGPISAKRRELFLCLPPFASPIAASSASPDAYSPRSLLSRLLLPLRRPSPVQTGGGSGDGEERLGCRVRFRRRGSNNRKRRNRRGAEEKGKVALEVEEPAVEASGGRSAPEVSGESSTELAINSGKKSDELSLNLGMGVGLVFLLARSVTEINKMVELREEMEILLKDIKDEAQKKDASSNCAQSKNHNFFQDDKVSFDLERVQHAMEPEAEVQSRFVRTTGSRICLMDKMEAELQVELECLQCTVEAKSLSLHQDQERVELVPEDADPSESLDGSLAKAYEVSDEASGIQCAVSAQELTKKLNQLLEMRQQEGITELESSFDHTGYSNGDLAENLCDDNGEVTEINEEDSGNYYGVSAQELERRLHELLETRQQERIAELESALECAERKLHEKEREICWWRDTTSLVSQHKNEELNR